MLAGGAFVPIIFTRTNDPAGKGGVGGRGGGPGGCFGICNRSVGVVAAGAADVASAGRAGGGQLCGVAGIWAVAGELAASDAAEAAAGAAAGVARATAAATMGVATAAAAEAPDDEAMSAARTAPVPLTSSPWPIADNPQSPSTCADRPGAQ